MKKIPLKLCHLLGEAKMEIFINEKKVILEKPMTAFEIRDTYKTDADVIILNGFIINSDSPLKANDCLTLIKKGEVPSHEELEALLVARHTPGVHDKVKKSVVGIAGLGGLGSNIAVSLARLGIGKLILVDFDVVEPSNLNRQQYFISHIGMPKTNALKELISRINPFVDVITINTYINENNVDECFKDAEIIVEAFDNPISKALLVNNILKKHPEKYIVAASGMAGYYSSNTIITKRRTSKFYLIGDGVSEAKLGCGLMAPRVAIAANHQANKVLQIILGENDL